MRWLFLLLLAANIAYVGWELNREPATNPGVTSAMTDTPRIVLLSELHDAQPAPVVTQVDAGSEPARQKSADTPLGTADAEAPVDESTTAVAKALPEPPVQPADTQTGQHAETPPDQVAAEDRCYSLGPFRELDELRAITRAIKSHVVDTSFRSLDQKEPSMYWVLLDSTDSLAQARALAQELVSRNIKDYFIIGGGAHKYGISLGQFSEKKRADRHAKHVRDLGFEPVVEPVFRSDTVYWLDYRMKARNTIPPQVFEDMLPESVNRLDRPCQP
jgi:hypothetical protein